MGLWGPLCAQQCRQEVGQPRASIVRLNSLGKGASLLQAAQEIDNPRLHLVGMAIEPMRIIVKDHQLAGAAAVAYALPDRLHFLDRRHGIPPTMEDKHRNVDVRGLFQGRALQQGGRALDWIGRQSALRMGLETMQARKCPQDDAAGPRRLCVRQRQEGQESTVAVAAEHERALSSEPFLPVPATGDDIPDVPPPVLAPVRLQMLLAVTGAAAIGGADDLETLCQQAQEDGIVRVDRLMRATVHEQDGRAPWCGRNETLHGHRPPVARGDGVFLMGERGRD